MLTTTYRDKTGHLHEVSGDSLEEIAQKLVDLEYEDDSAHLTVHDEPGFVRGWVGTCWVDGTDGEPQLRPYWRAA
jgi:hypothetical protein